MLENENGPFPWQAGIEGMITGLHERVNPQGSENRDASASLDGSFVQKPPAAEAREEVSRVGKERGRTL